jgi:hypothetical protein
VISAGARGELGCAERVEAGRERARERDEMRRGVIRRGELHQVTLAQRQQGRSRARRSATAAVRKDLAVQGARIAVRHEHRRPRQHLHRLVEQGPVRVVARQREQLELGAVHHARSV